MRAMRDDRLVDTADLRNRPVVLESGSPEDQPRRRPRPRTMIGVSAATMLAAVGLVAGSWSIWSAVSTTTPAGPPAPLWFSPPAPVVTPDGDSHAPASSTDDHGGNRTDDHGANSGNNNGGPGAGADDHGGADHEGGNSGPGGASGTGETGGTGGTGAPTKPTTNAPATEPAPVPGHSGPGRGGIAPPSTSKGGGDDQSGGGHDSERG